MEKSKAKSSGFLHEKVGALKEAIRDRSIQDPEKFGSRLLKDAAALERLSEGKSSFRAWFYKFVVNPHPSIVEAAKVYEKAATEFLKGGNEVMAAQCFESAAVIRSKVAEKIKNPMLSLHESVYAERNFLRATHFYSSTDPESSKRSEKMARQEMRKIGVHDHHFNAEMSKALKNLAAHADITAH